MTLTPEDLVRREVYYCVSSLVSTLAQGNATTADMTSDMSCLLDQAFELAVPIDDWEKAAIEAGWQIDHEINRWFEPDTNDKEGSDFMYESVHDLCEMEDIEPYQREVFEHWIVSDWLADKLEAKGEKVDKDFAGLTIWARTTTGQRIACDWVIEAICEELNQ